MSRVPEPRELDPAAAGLIRAGLTGDKFATDRTLTRAFEADVDGLFFALTVANLAGRVLADACGSEAQAVALLDNLINGLVRQRAQPRRYSSSSVRPGLGLLPGLGLGLSFPLHPRGVFAASLLFGLMCRDTLRGLVRSLLAARPAALPGHPARVGSPGSSAPPSGSGRRVHIRDAL